MLKDALGPFKASGLKEVFVSVEEDNKSEALFASEDVTQTRFREVARKHGDLQTLNMYGTVTVVPERSFLAKRLSELSVKLGG